MRCADRQPSLLALAAALLAGCGNPRPPAHEELRAPETLQVVKAPSAVIPAVVPRGDAPPAPAALPPPRTMKSWSEVRMQAAHRLASAHPETSYVGDTPETLLAIPVLEVELNGDGSIRKVVVLRHPRNALDTTQLAIDAMHRAAPFGNVSRLPRPWKFVETFLFDDDRRFKPKSLD